LQIVREKDLYQITFLTNFLPVSCYLIENENELILVDTALSFSHKGIIDTLNSIKKPIKTILLTHSHHDHIGSLSSLKNLYPDIKVYVSKREYEFKKDDLFYSSEEENEMKKNKIYVDGILEEGDSIGPLVAISTPGHTPGSMSFFHQKNKSLIAGDAFQTQGGLAVSGELKLLFPFPAIATWNKEAALESARKIQSLNPALLAVGHGKILKYPQLDIEQAILRAEKKFKK
jgi:glyoxylase-like metal-dependent hydrolase (beta-lactamase superfamily II)